MKILFVITGLGLGGAERMLFKLASGLSNRFEPFVVALEDTPAGLFGEFNALGIPVCSLGMKGLGSVPAGIARLATLVRRFRPDVVNTWLYHADLVGGIAARLGGCRAVAWNIRNSNLSALTSTRGTRAVLRLNSRLSRLLPKRILCCSEEARRIHVALGYDAERFEVIPNGFDLATFRPDRQAAADVRRELRIAPQAPLIGLVARFDPQKNHEGFVEAAAHLCLRMPEARFVLVGQGCDERNERLMGWIRSRGLTESFRLLGRRDDVARLTSALDLATSTSIYGEAFPNVLGEAMACEVPCVATDVGDSRQIIGDTGRVVATSDAHAMANAWLDMLEKPREQRAALGLAARQRVSQNFELGAVRRRYEAAFEALAAWEGAPCKV